MKVFEDLEELSETLDELYEYFELKLGEWPMISVATEDGYISGVIDDHLYQILIRLYEIHEKIKDKE